MAGNSQLKLKCVDVESIMTARHDTLAIERQIGLADVIMQGDGEILRVLVN